MQNFKNKKEENKLNNKAYFVAIERPDDLLCWRYPTFDINANKNALLFDEINTFHETCFKSIKAINLKLKTLKANEDVKVSSVIVKYQTYNYVTKDLSVYRAETCKPFNTRTNKNCVFSVRTKMQWDPQVSSNFDCTELQSLDMSKINLNLCDFIIEIFYQTKKINYHAKLYAIIDEHGDIIWLEDLNKCILNET